MYNLLIFVYSSDSSLLEYIQNQIIAIQNLFPELPIETVNEFDDRLVMYNNKPDRFPCFMIFEEGFYKTSINGKFENDYVISWLTNNLL